MDLRKCEHCGNTFWGKAEARLCPLCAVAEKAKEKAVELPPAANDPQVRSAAA